jgi:hypothetical protein
MKTKRYMILISNGKMLSLPERLEEALHNAPSTVSINTNSQTITSIMVRIMNSISQTTFL